MLKQSAIVAVLTGLSALATAGITATAAPAPANPPFTGYLAKCVKNLNIRTHPKLNATVVGMCYPTHREVVVRCLKVGDRYAGPNAPSSRWYRINDLDNKKNGYVVAGYVKLDDPRSERKVPNC